LLIEAGGTDDWSAIHNPAEAPMLLGSAVDWAYSTTIEPQLNNRQIAWPRGKVLGGSGSTNFLGHVRGNRYDFDHWQELGNQGWSYIDTLPYFKKSENWERGASAYRGTGGPINVMELPVVNPMTSAFFDAGVELGWSRNDDYNGASQDGFGVFQFEIHKGKRQSTAITYLHPVENRPNLTV
jgi:choline dehydrogenase